MFSIIFIAIMQETNFSNYLPRREILIVNIRQTNDLCVNLNRFAMVTRFLNFYCMF